MAGDDQPAPAGRREEPREPAEATTLSTIAVQSGTTRIVIALLQKRNWIELKALEMTPELSHLAASLDEALLLQQQHDEVLQKLASKESPVEDLLNQADQLIARQDTKAATYAAMAESLAHAWRDLNGQLQRRRQVLAQCVMFHRRSQKFTGIMDLADSTFGDVSIPSNPEAAEEAIRRLLDVRKGVLEASMLTLQEGNQLLEKLRALSTREAVDSRPNQLTASVKAACLQVEEWLEKLHDRRRMVDVLFTNRRIILEQCLALAGFYADLDQLQRRAEQTGRDTRAICDLGDSASSAEILLYEHSKVEQAYKVLQDRGLQLVRAADSLVQSGTYARDQPRTRAYAVLERCSQLTTAAERRRTLLTSAAEFFRLAQQASDRLLQLEGDLQAAPAGDQGAALSRVTAALEEAARPALLRGQEILREAGPAADGTQGVSRCMDDLRRQIDLLGKRCREYQERQSLHLRAHSEFVEKYNLVLGWMTNVGDSFLRTHTDLGQTTPQASQFVTLHEQLHGDLISKGREIDHLLSSEMPPQLDRNQAREIQTKGDDLRSQWSLLQNLTDGRLDLSRLYLRFHQLADQLQSSLDEMAPLLEGGALSEEQTRRVEDRWLTVQQQYQQLATVGQRLIDKSHQVRDPYLQVAPARACAEAILQRFKNSQITITENYERVQLTTTTIRRVQKQWERCQRDVKRIEESVVDLKSELYPVLRESGLSVDQRIRQCEDRIDRVLPLLKQAEDDIDQMSQTAQKLGIKGAGETSREAERLALELDSKKHALASDATDYHEVLQMMTSYLRKLKELDASVEKRRALDASRPVPRDNDEVQQALREYEAAQQAFTELFRMAGDELDRVVAKVRHVEPPAVAEHDVTQLREALERETTKWEDTRTTRKELLDRQVTTTVFNSELNVINSHLTELSNQLSQARGHYGDSLHEAKETKKAFKTFEETISGTGRQIETFISTAEEYLSSAPQPAAAAAQLEQLQRRWRTLQQQVVDNRRLTDLAIQYYQLLEQAEDWYKGGGRLLVDVARRVTQVRSPEEAHAIREEIGEFLSPGEQQQGQRLDSAAAMAQQLYGGCPRRLTAVTEDSREMVDSLEAIQLQLHTLVQSLEQMQNERDSLRREKDQLSVDREAAVQEAEVARTTAAAAEEARRAAEVAAKALEVMPQPTTPLMVPKVDVCTETMVTEIKQVTTIDRSTQKMPTARADASTQDEELISLVDAGGQGAAPWQESVTRESLAAQQASPPKRHKKGEDAPPVTPAFVEPLLDQTVQDGVRHTLKARVSGIPAPKVSWQKDGISCDNNPDYAIAHHQGVCSLTIEETMVDDSGQYTCRAWNSAGAAESTCRLTVKDSAAEEELAPPLFTHQLSDARAREGRALLLSATVTGNPLPVVSWLRDGACVDASPDYVITYNNGECSLRVEEALPQDAGTFVCRATNVLGADQTSATVRVEPRTPSEAPRFTSPLSNVMARAGQKLRLECAVRGLPHPELSWTHNNRPVRENHDTKLTFDGRRATLTINEAFPKDAGMYTIMARNPAGEATCSCNVSVKGRLPTETSDSEMASDLEPVKPSIPVKLRDLTVQPGERAQLDCVITGQPEPEVIWYHGDQPVKESKACQLLFHGDRCTLVINRAAPEDAGDYAVVAINSAGEASSACTLRVLPLKPSTPEQPAQKPKFVRSLSDVSAEEGQRQVLEVEVTGSPEPIVIWMKDGREVKSSESMKITHTETVYRLEIVSILPIHAGTYMCVASNSAGEARCFSKISVQPPAVKKVSVTPVSSLSRRKPPSFVQIFKDQRAEYGDEVRFECIINGWPKPQVEWLFDDSGELPEGCSVSSEGQHHELRITCSEHLSSGEIKCVAENDIGKATCAAWLALGEDLERPSSRASERKTRTSSVKKTTITETREETQQVINGDQRPRKATEQRRSEEAYSRFADEPAHTKVLRTSSEQVRRETMVRDGTGDGPEEGAEARPAPPRFTAPLQGTVVREGEPVTMAGQFSGTADITWYKDGEELRPGSRAVTSQDDGHVTMTIDSASEEDVGKYTCCLKNAAGTSKSTAELLVTKILEAPTFEQRLQAQVAQPGQEVTLEVTVSGKPEPEVTWTRDGHPVTSDDHLQVTRHGDRHVLTITNVKHDHAGKYAVSAKNEAGESTSIADFLVTDEVPAAIERRVISTEYTDGEEPKTVVKKTTVMSSSESALDAEEPAKSSSKHKHSHKHKKKDKDKEKEKKKKSKKSKSSESIEEQGGFPEESMTEGEKSSKSKRKKSKKTTEDVEESVKRQKPETEESMDVEDEPIQSADSSPPGEVDQKEAEVIPAQEDLEKLTEAAPPQEDVKPENIEEDIEMENVVEKRQEVTYTTPERVPVVPDVDEPEDEEEVDYVVQEPTEDADAQPDPDIVEEIQGVRERVIKTTVERSPSPDGKVPANETKDNKEDEENGTERNQGHDKESKDVIPVQPGGEPPMSIVDGKDILPEGDVPQHQSSDDVDVEETASFSVLEKSPDKTHTTKPTQDIGGGDDSFDQKEQVEEESVGDARKHVAQSETEQSVPGTDAEAEFVIEMAPSQEKKDAIDDDYLEEGSTDVDAAAEFAIHGVLSPKDKEEPESEGNEEIIAKQMSQKIQEESKTGEDQSVPDADANAEFVIQMAPSEEKKDVIDEDAPEEGTADTDTAANFVIQGALSSVEIEEHETEEAEKKKDKKKSQEVQDEPKTVENQSVPDADAEAEFVIQMAPSQEEKDAIDEEYSDDNISDIDAAADFAIQSASSSKKTELETEKTEDSEAKKTSQEAQEEAKTGKAETVVLMDQGEDANHPDQVLRVTDMATDFVIRESDIKQTPQEVQASGESLDYGETGMEYIDENMKEGGQAIPDTETATSFVTKNAPQTDNEELRESDDGKIEEPLEDTTAITAEVADKEPAAKESTFSKKQGDEPRGEEEVIIDSRKSSEKPHEEVGISEELAISEPEPTEENQRKRPVKPESELELMDEGEKGSSGSEGDEGEYDFEEARAVKGMPNTEMNKDEQMTERPLTPEPSEERPGDDEKAFVKKAESVTVSQKQEGRDESAEEESDDVEEMPEVEMQPSEHRDEREIEQEGKIHDDEPAPKKEASLDAGHERDESQPEPRDNLALCEDDLVNVENVASTSMKEHEEEKDKIALHQKKIMALLEELGTPKESPSEEDLSAERRSEGEQMYEQTKAQSSEIAPGTSESLAKCLPSTDALPMEENLTEQSTHVASKYLLTESSSGGEARKDPPSEPQEPVLASVYRFPGDGALPPTDASPHWTGEQPAEAPTEPLLSQATWVPSAPSQPILKPSAPVPPPKPARPSRPPPGFPPEPSAEPQQYQQQETPYWTPEAQYQAPRVPYQGPVVSYQAPHDMSQAPPMPTNGLFHVPVVEPYAQFMQRTHESGTEYHSQQLPSAPAGQPYPTGVSQGPASQPISVSPPQFAVSRVRAPAPVQHSAEFIRMPAPPPPPPVAPAVPPKPQYVSCPAPVSPVPKHYGSPGHVPLPARFRVQSTRPHSVPRYRAPAPVSQQAVQTQPQAPKYSQKQSMTPSAPPQPLTPVQIPSSPGLSSSQSMIQSTQSRFSSNVCQDGQVSPGFRPVRPPTSPLPRYGGESTSTTNRMQSQSTYNQCSQNEPIQSGFRPVYAPGSPRHQFSGGSAASVIKSSQSVSTSNQYYQNGQTTSGFRPVKSPVPQALPQTEDAKSTSTMQTIKSTSNTIWNTDDEDEYWSSGQVYRDGRTSAPPRMVITYVARTGPVRSQRYAPAQEDRTSQWDSQSSETRWETITNEQRQDMFQRQEDVIRRQDQTRATLPRRSASSVGEMRKKIESDTRTQAQNFRSHPAPAAPAPAPVVRPVPKATSPAPASRPAPKPMLPLPPPPDQLQVPRRPVRRAPTPTKFIPGRFSGSDYESDLDERIPTRWNPDGYEYIDRRRFCICGLLSSHKEACCARQERPVTPPSRFDRPAPVRDTPPDRPFPVAVPRGRSEVRRSQVMTKRSSSAPATRRVTAPAAPRQRDQAPPRAARDASWQRREVKQEITSTQEDGGRTRRWPPVVSQKSTSPPPPPPPPVTTQIAQTANEISQSLRKMTNQTSLREVAPAPRVSPVPSQPVRSPQASHFGVQKSQIFSKTTETRGLQQPKPSAPRLSPIPPKPTQSSQMSQSTFKKSGTVSKTSSQSDFTQQQQVSRAPVSVFKPPTVSLTQPGQSLPPNKQSFFNQQHAHESLDRPGVAGFKDSSMTDAGFFNREEGDGFTKIETRFEKTFQERMEKTEISSGHRLTIAPMPAVPASHSVTSQPIVQSPVCDESSQTRRTQQWVRSSEGTTSSPMPPSPQPVVTSPVAPSPGPGFQRAWQQHSTSSLGRSTSGTGRGSPWVDDQAGYASEPELAALSANRRAGASATLPRASVGQSSSKSMMSQAMSQSSSGYTGSLGRQGKWRAPAVPGKVTRTGSDVQDYESHLATKWTPAGSAAGTASPFRPVQAPSSAGSSSQWSSAMSEEQRSARESTQQAGTTTTTVKEEFHSQRSMRTEESHVTLPPGAVSVAPLQSPLPSRAIQPRSPLLLRAVPPSSEAALRAASPDQSEDEEVAALLWNSESPLSRSESEPTVLSGPLLSPLADSTTEPEPSACRGGPLTQLARWLKGQAAGLTRRS